MPYRPVQDGADLSARITELEAEISRHQVVQQQLARAKVLLDSELQRFTVIQQYVQNAALADDLESFYQLTIESIVEAFEFEVALVMRSEDDPSRQRIVASFGFEDSFIGEYLTLEEGWLDASESRIVKSGEPLLDAWRILGLKEVILCSFLNKDGGLGGVVAGGRTDGMGDYFDALSDELRSPFHVMVGQAGALLLNQEFATETRKHNAALQALTESFSRFVPFEFLELLGRDSIQSVMPADNVSLEMTVLFVDLREFTTLSESLGPEKTFGLLNEYLEVMQPPISASGGFINHYQGDGIMALFHNGADTALAAASGMVCALDELNELRVERGDIALRIGMGINTGELMLGAIGGTERLDSNVVGDSANLASRTEGLTKLYGSLCMLTDHTVKRLANPDNFVLRELDRVIVRGRVEPVAVYELLDVEPKAVRAQKISTAAQFSQALSLYRESEFAMAIGAFAQCVNACADDAAAKLYVQRCAELVQHTPGPDWRGVTVLDSA
jgi:class 3 adenylate cyclase